MMKNYRVVSLIVPTEIVLGDVMPITSTPTTVCAICASDGVKESPAEICRWHYDRAVSALLEAQYGWNPPRAGSGRRDADCAPAATTDGTPRTLVQSGTQDALTAAIWALVESMEGAKRTDALRLKYSATP